MLYVLVEVPCSIRHGHLTRDRQQRCSGSIKWLPILEHHWIHKHFLRADVQRYIWPLGREKYRFMQKALCQHKNHPWINSWVGWLILYYHNEIWEKRKSTAVIWLTARKAKQMFVYFHILGRVIWWPCLCTCWASHL